MRRALTLILLGAVLLACQGPSRPREEPPAHLARLRAWRSSAPAFWDMEQSGLLPWSRDVDALVDDTSAGPAAGLACEVVLHDYAEHNYIPGPNSELADITVLAWLGMDRGPFFLRADGPDNRNNMRMAFPLTGLQKGDPVVFELRDRDFVGFSAIDRVEGVLDGPPPFRFTGRAKVAEIACRPLARAALDRAMLLHEPEAKRRVEEFGAHRPDPRRADLAFDDETRKRAREGVLELAALGGWDDPRVTAVMGSLRSAEADMDSALRRLVTEERARLGVETTLDEGLVLKARRVSDEPPQVELDVKNTLPRPVMLSNDFFDVEGFGVDGAWWKLVPDEVVSLLTVPPGGTVTLHYRATSGEALARPRAAMILRSHRREVLVAVERRFIAPSTGAAVVAHLVCERKRACVIRLATEGASVSDAVRGLRIDGRVRGERSGFHVKPGEIDLEDKKLAPEDVAIAVSFDDPRVEIPWSVATDR